MWKTNTEQNLGNVRNLLIQDHHLIKGARILTLEKLSSEELYSMLITKVIDKPSSNVYFENVFPNTKFDWTKMDILNRIKTINMYLRSFQYKILNRILFLNQKLFFVRPRTYIHILFLTYILFFVFLVFLLFHKLEPKKMVIGTGWWTKHNIDF